jgi:hypothetical protein
VTAARTRSHVFAAHATWLLVEFHERAGRTNYALKAAPALDPRQSPGDRQAEGRPTGRGPQVVVA